MSSKILPFSDDPNKRTHLVTYRILLIRLSKFDYFLLLKFEGKIFRRESTKNCEKLSLLEGRILNKIK